MLKIPERRTWPGRAENALAIVALLTMAALPLIEVASRKLLGRGVAGSISLVQHLTLWTAFLGAALAARSDRHLALSTAAFLPDWLSRPARLFTSAAAAAVVAALVAAGVDLVAVERRGGDRLAWGIPVWAAIAIIPAALAVVAGRIVWRSGDTWKGRIPAALGLAIPAALAAWPSLRDAGLLWPACGLLALATALGLPIFAALGGAALLMFWSEASPIAAVPVDVYRLSAHPMLPAVPLFTLGGYLLSEGGASRRLTRAFTALFGWMPGGLAVVTALVLAFFTPLTGASGVTILSMGGLLLPILTRAGYPERSSIGLVTVSGSIGLLLPPSLPVILYGVAARQPIDQLFLGALVPGLLLIAAVAGWGASRGWNAGVARTPFEAREALRAAWDARWELLLPVVVLGSIFGGLATLVEAAALTVLYAFAIEFVLHRDLSLRTDLPRIAVEAATMLGGFLIILGMALAFTNYLIYAEAPVHAMEWVRGHVASPIVFLLVLNVFLLAVGAIMDIYSAIFVVVPLILPMGAAYGIDPVHLGVIFLANMELGYLMPPMGENLFLSSFRFNKPLSSICVSTLPFLLILLGAVLLITYVPAMTLGPASLAR